MLSHRARDEEPDYCMVRRYAFFFNDTATTELYTLSLHDALPIFTDANLFLGRLNPEFFLGGRMRLDEDRKSTRLNSSHEWSSYAFFCWKKKKVVICASVLWVLLGVSYVWVLFLEVI